MLTKRRKLSLPESMILSALILACIATLDISLYIHYEKTCPTTADSQSGHVYPLRNERRIVYLTSAENRTMDICEASSFAVCFGLVAFAMVKGDRRQRGKGSYSPAVTQPQNVDHNHAS
jgi:hypothetical protein